MPQTEDDTFNALRRIKFMDAVKIIIDEIDSSISTASLIEYFAHGEYIEWINGWTKSLKDRDTGWTLDEFVKECKRWHYG